jgi:hypothetical protein
VQCFEEPSSCPVDIDASGGSLIRLVAGRPGEHSGRWSLTRSSTTTDLAEQKAERQSR